MSYPQALERDGYRCMLSGKLDATIKGQLQRKIQAATIASRAADHAAAAAADNPATSELAENAARLAKEARKLNLTAQNATNTLASFPNAPTMCVTNAAHIFSEANNTDLGNDKKVPLMFFTVLHCISHPPLIFQMEYASSMWAMMKQFGQPGFMDELDGSKIHRLANILTLEQFLHTQFDRLALWLEADVVSPNQRCGYHNDPKLCRHNPIHTASAQSMTT